MYKVVILVALAVAAQAGVISQPAYAYGGYAAPAYAAQAYAAPAYAAAPLVAKVATPVLAAKVAVVEAPQPYSFGYSLQTEDGAQIQRQETSDANNAKQGSYGYTGPDGLYRQVDYVADAAGFRAVVTTNEHGTAPQNPADVQVNAAEPPYKVLPAAAPVIKAVAPVVHHAPIVKAAIAAPVYAHAPIVKAAVAAPIYAAHSYAAPAYAAHSFAAPAYAAAAPVYGHAYAAPAVVKAAAPVYAAGPAYAAAPASVAYKTLHSHAPFGYAAQAVKAIY